MSEATGHEATKGDSPALGASEPCRGAFSATVSDSCAEDAVATDPGAGTKTIRSTICGAGRLTSNSDSPQSTRPMRAVQPGHAQPRLAPRLDIAPARNISLSRSSRLETGTSSPRADSIAFNSGSGGICGM